MRKPAPTTEPGKGSTQDHPAVGETPPAGGGGTADDRRPLSLLAGEMFGADYHGAPAVPGAGEDAEGGAALATRVEPGTPGPGAEEGAPPEGETPPGGGVEEGGGEEGEPISSLAELIERLELDPEWAETLTVPVKVDGKEAEVPIKDLLASYQMREAAARRLEEAKEKSKAVRQEAAAAQETLNAQFAVAAALIKKAEAELSTGVSPEEMQRLRVDDPGEYAARQDEMRERREKISEVKRKAAQDYEAAVVKEREQETSNRRAALQSEAASLLDKVPEWRDPEKAKAGLAKLRAYLLGQGFGKEDVDGVIDHRLIVLGRKAMLHDESQAAAGPALKKFYKVPKTLKPGAPKLPEAAGRERERRAMADHRRNGTVESALAALKARRRAP